MYEVMVMENDKKRKLVEFIVVFMIFTLCLISMSIYTIVIVVTHSMLFSEFMNEIGLKETWYDFSKFTYTISGFFVYHYLMMGITLIFTYLFMRCSKTFNPITYYYFRSPDYIGKDDDKNNQSDTNRLLPNRKSILNSHNVPFNEDDIVFNVILTANTKEGRISSAILSSPDSTVYKSRINLWGLEIEEINNIKECHDVDAFAIMANVLTKFEFVFSIFFYHDFVIVRQERFDGSSTAMRFSIFGRLGDHAKQGSTQEGVTLIEMTQAESEEDVVGIIDNLESSNNMKI